MSTFPQIGRGSLKNAEKLDVHKMVRAQTGAALHELQGLTREEILAHKPVGEAFPDSPLDPVAR
jgi:hypothetical protein